MFLSSLGLLRVVGSIKLQLSFAKEPYKRDYILQKRPVILRSLLIVATPSPLFSRDKKETSRQKATMREQKIYIYVFTKI